MTFKAVLFDLDGTLLNSIEGIADAMNILLKSLNYPTHPVDTYKYFVGEGIRELVIRALPERFQHTSDIDKLVIQYRAIYDQTWQTKSDPYDGIPQMLDKLTAQNKKMAILSNKSDDFTKRMTAKLLSKWQFESVMGSRPDVPNKPSPEAALETSEILGIPPGDFHFMGDSGVDMKTAVNSGMVAVGALWGFRKVDELLASGASILLKHPMELFEI